MAAFAEEDVLLLVDFFSFFGGLSPRWFDSDLTAMASPSASDAT